MNAPERVPPAVQAPRLTVRVYESSAGWCVRWQSDRMKAPAFWYFGASEIEARRVARAMQGWPQNREATT